jgi:hypothetical protein
MRVSTLKNSSNGPANFMGTVTHPRSRLDSPKLRGDGHIGFRIA